MKPPRTSIAATFGRHGCVYLNVRSLMSSALRLDCETRDSAEESLIGAFGGSPEVLRRFVSDPQHLANFEEHWDQLPQFDDFYFERACETLGMPRLPEEVCWFHGTRVRCGTTFSEGILPLGEALPFLKAALVDVLEDQTSRREVERAFERKGGFAFHFRNKLENPLHWGPYAILVREVCAGAAKGPNGRGRRGSTSARNGGRGSPVGGVGQPGCATGPRRSEGEERV